MRKFHPGDHVVVKSREELEELVSKEMPQETREIFFKYAGRTAIVVPSLPYLNEEDCGDDPNCDINIVDPSDKIVFCESSLKPYNNKQRFEDE